MLAVPPGAFAVIDVSPDTEKEVAGVPPNITEVVPVKYSPPIVTEVPAVHVDGLKPVMMGDGHS